jgi:H+/gluconate symporter-like permease
MVVLFRISLIVFLLIILIKLKANLALALTIDAFLAGILFRIEFLVLLKMFP